VTAVNRRIRIACTVRDYGNRETTGSSTKLIWPVSW
jgi:hypothetical protein